MGNYNDKNYTLIEHDQYTSDWINQESERMDHLNPIKHPQQDFFIADIFDAISLQLDLASMEFPLFALRAGDKKSREYKQGGFSIKISPSVDYGLATIHDKDIWIYCISKIMQAMREGEEISRNVHFTIYDYLKTTNRGVGGREYELAKNSLDRLRSTTITTDIETNDRRESRGFGLVDSWRIVEEKDGRMIRVSVTLPEWLYRSITSRAILTISPDYFRLRRPLDRRIYELARKHCGYNNSWKFDLKTLHERSGSSASLKEFRKAIKSLAESNQLPDYSVEFDGSKNQIIFFRRVDLKNLTKALEKEIKEQKTKRKRITEYEASIMARPGEEWEDLLKRIGKDYHVIFNRDN